MKIFKTKEAENMGLYKKTSIDLLKEDADILIKNVSDGKFYCSSKIELKGKGVSKIGEMYKLTDNALNNAKNNFKVICDF